MAQSKDIIRGTLILVAGNIAVKIIGALFKLPLANIIGADGMGLYNAAFIVYDIFLVLATAGCPLAVSKLVASCSASGRGSEPLRILRVSRFCFFIIGSLLSAVMFFGAGPFSRLIGNTRAYYSILVLAPSVLFVSLMSSYRGYYQGTNDMVPTTVSQIIEAVVRLIFGLGLAVFFTLKGFDASVVAAGALAGITVGEFSSTFSLAMLHRKKMKKRPFNRETCPRVSPLGIAKRLFMTSAPIGIGVIIISIINMLDNSVVMRRLQYAGFSEYEANVLYGTYNMASTVFSLPVTIISALQTSVFPILSCAFAQKNTGGVSRAARASMRITVTVGFASSALFLAMSQPLNNLVYFHQPAAVKIVVPLLTLLSPCAVVFTLTMMSSTILLSCDRMLAPTVSMIAGGCVCLISNWVLVGIREIGIFGVPAGLLACYSVTSVINLVSIKRSCNVKLELGSAAARAILPAAALGVSGLLAYRLALIRTGVICASFISVCTGVAVFIPSLFISGCVTQADLRIMPGGKKLIRVLGILRLIPKDKQAAGYCHTA